MKVADILKIIGVIIGIIGTISFLITTLIDNESLLKLNSLSKALMMLGLLLYSIGVFSIKINRK